MPLHLLPFWQTNEQCNPVNMTDILVVKAKLYSKVLYQLYKKLFVIKHVKREHFQYFNHYLQKLNEGKIIALKQEESYKTTIPP